jgi:hypothetical protein
MKKLIFINLKLKIHFKLFIIHTSLVKYDYSQTFQQQITQQLYAYHQYIL